MPNEKSSARDIDDQEDVSNIDLEKSSEIDFENYSMIIDQDEEPQPFTNTQKQLINSLDMESIYLFWVKYFNLSQRTMLFEHLFDEFNREYDIDILDVHQIYTLMHEDYYIQKLYDVIYE